jgi:hypothetical protein
MGMHLSKHFTVIIVLLLVLLGATCANAATLSAGGILFPAPAEPDPTGGTIIASSTVPFIAPNYSGSLMATVRSGDPSNTLGGLTFTYQILNVTGTHSVNRLSVNGYGGFTVDASYQALSPNIAPAYVDREITGDSIGFSFASAPIGTGAIGNGQSGSVLVLQTNAPAFIAAPAFVIDGQTAPVTAFSPIPEPGTVTLCLVGIALGIAYRRRRYR